MFDVYIDKFNNCAFQVYSTESIDEAIAYCNNEVAEMQKFTGDDSDIDGKRRVRFYVCPNAFDPEEGPEEIYSTDWYYQD